MNTNEGIDTGCMCVDKEYIDGLTDRIADLDIEWRDAEQKVKEQISLISRLAYELKLQYEHEFAFFEEVSAIIFMDEESDFSNPSETMLLDSVGDFIKKRTDRVLSVLDLMKETREALKI